MRDGRDRDLDRARAPLRASRPSAAPNGSHQPARSPSAGCPAARRGRPGRSPSRRRSPRRGRKLVEPLDQRMADIGRRRPAEAAVRLRLEGQEREDVVDIGAHRLRAARTPGPDGRADVVDDRDRRRAWRAPARATRCVKSGLSMMTRSIGPRRRPRRRPSRAMRDRIVGSRAIDGGKPHHGDVVQRETGSAMPSAAIACAADAAEGAAAPRRASLQRAHQLGAELVAQFLAGDDKDASAAQPPAAPSTGRSTATTKEAEAIGLARASPSGRATRDEPAPTAMPESPARRRFADGARPDRRHVDAKVLSALRRLDEDARPRGAPHGRSEDCRDCAAPGAASGRCPQGPRWRARADPRRPPPDRCRRRRAQPSSVEAERRRRAVLVARLGAPRAGPRSDQGRARVRARRRPGGRAPRSSRTAPRRTWSSPRAMTSLHVLPVAQQRVGAEQRRESRPARTAPTSVTTSGRQSSSARHDRP